MTRLRLLACAMMLAGTAASAEASVLYDNLSLDRALAGGSASVTSLVGENPFGASFSSPGAAVNLTSITLWMSGDSASPGSFSVNVLPDSGAPGSPSPDLSGTPLVSQLFSDAVLTDFPAPVTLSTNVILQPNSRYWVVVDESPDPLGDSDPTSAQWLLAPDDGGFGVAGEFLYSGGSAAPNSASNGAFMMAVDPEDVPEPATLAVLGLGLTASRRCAGGGGPSPAETMPVCSPAPTGRNRQWHPSPFRPPAAPAAFPRISRSRSRNLPARWC